MNFAEKIKAFVSRQTTETVPSFDYTPLDFVKTRKGILKELVLSKQSGKLIGVYSRVLGEGMFLTRVEAIQPHGKDEQIVFHRYDMSGQMLARTRISVDEIHMVCPFNKMFRSPALDTASADSVLSGLL